MKNTTSFADLEFGKLAADIACSHLAGLPSNGFSSGTLSDKLAKLFREFKPAQFSKHDPEIPANTPDVKELRQAGHKVRVCEYRRLQTGGIIPRYMFAKTQKAANKEGFQVVEITMADGRETKGKATCLPTDNFNRKYGRLLAISRALAKLEKVNQ